MSHETHERARIFALEVVQKLRQAGFEALWAGGCVRDMLLGKTPKDYDVATSAQPEQVREVFGRRRTLAIGAAFGVIAVIGPRGVAQIQVATFRSDASYSDGRHPDSVTYSTAREDAQRRDFTINGLFYDPLEEQVLDYVGGQDDLRIGVVRAIGDAQARIAEDKLRMLRAVRFAATLGFTIESQTMEAVRSSAAGIVIVSAERIADEMRNMLGHPRRARAMELLCSSELLPYVLPEAAKLAENEPQSWQATLAVLAELGEAPFPRALAALLHRCEGGAAVVPEVCQRWRLSREESDTVGWLLGRLELALEAQKRDWPSVQRMLTHRWASSLVALVEAVVRSQYGDPAVIGFLKEKIALPPDELNPPLLLTGQDLKSLGIPAGPFYSWALSQVRDAQLNGQIVTNAAARELALSLWANSSQGELNS